MQASYASLANMGLSFKAFFLGAGREGRHNKEEIWYPSEGATSQFKI